MKSTYVILFLFILAFSSCGDKTIITQYENGEKFEEFQYTGDSLRHGTYYRYAQGGVLLEESNYVEGKLNGIRKIYTENGILEITELYENDILNGPCQVYHANGKIKMDCNYNNNVLEGIVKVYYPSGNQKEEVLFVDNVEEGPFKEFHENGNLKWEGTYRNGNNEFGLLKEYDESGELIRKMMCDDRAICTTTWTKDGSHLTQKKSEG